MKDFSIRHLPFGAICLADDQNFPLRAEAVGHLDIDGQMPAVCREAGIKTGAVVVDIGAFVGDTATVFAEFGAEVHAFEPFFDAFVCLSFNTRKLNVKCYNSPVGNNERVKLVYECNGENFGMRRVRVTDEPGPLVAIQIDTLRLKSCAVMKVDCEGFEIPALLGARETIARCRPVLFVEMYEEALRKHGFSPGQLEQTIRELGYSLEMWGEPPRWDWYCRPLV